MGKFADRVFTQPEDIRRLEALIEALAVNARVSLRLNDGNVTEGVVAVTPTIQIFRNPDGQEGTHGIVKLIDPKRPEWTESVWLGDIQQVVHLDAVRKGVSKA